MKIAVKNMVCNRCIKVVKQVLNDANITYSSVTLGNIETAADVNASEINKLRELLENEGFEILDDKNQKIVETIKNLVIQLVNENDDQHQKLSYYLSKHLAKDYSSISQLFSSIENITIEQYYILQKIEKVKELLVYGEKNLSEIAFDLGYSSVAHLSAQFKKITGFTPSAFRQLKHHNRKSLDSLSG